MPDSACYVKEQLDPAHDALFILTLTPSAPLLPVFSDGARASYDLDCFITTQVSRAPDWALCIWNPWLSEEKHSAAYGGQKLSDLTMGVAPRLCLPSQVTLTLELFQLYLLTAHS